MKQFKFKSKMVASLSGATGTAEGAQAEQLNSNYGLLNAVNERGIVSSVNAINK
mgnify:CR=1 FL=1